jgi:pilus assembly protein CpaB
MKFLNRNTLLIALAVIVFLVVMAFLRPAPEVKVVAAAGDLPAGHILTDSDLVIRQMPKSLLPTDVFAQPTLAVGQALKLDRAKGDLIQASQLGTDVVQLQPDERAIAVQVTDATGLAGLLKAGDRVGVVANIVSQNGMEAGTFSKVVVENLRVLYIAPSFVAEDTADAAGSIVTPDATTGLVVQRDRDKSGPVVLAVPVDMQAVAYDFSKVDSAIPGKTRYVSALELLSGLTNSDAKLSLYLMPKDAGEFKTSGIYLPDLIITAGPTPTPTGTLDPRFLTLTPAGTGTPGTQTATTPTPKK